MTAAQRSVAKRRTFAPVMYMYTRLIDRLCCHEILEGTKIHVCRQSDYLYHDMLSQ